MSTNSTMSPVSAPSPKPGPVARPGPKPFALTVQRLSDVEIEDVKFFWSPYIPAATVTLLYGYGGIGKSFLSCALAADASAGRALPGHVAAVPPQKVLMVSAEDDAAHVIKPRMLKLGANMDNIFVSEDQFVLNLSGIRALREAMSHFEATIVVLDPLVSYLGGQVDMNRSNETREMMGPLGEAARDTGCAVVVVHHSKKDGRGRSANRAMGSADFINSVRSALMVDEDPEGQKFMAHTKHNWSRQGKTLQFSIVEDKFRWQGAYANEVLGMVPGTTHNSAEAKAQQWLRQLLSAGGMSVKAVEEAGIAAGHQKRTVLRAKIGIVTAKNNKGTWEWHLNSGPTVAPSLPSIPPPGPTPEEVLAKLGHGPEHIPGLDPAILAAARARLDARTEV